MVVVVGVVVAVVVVVVAVVNVVVVVVAQPQSQLVGKKTLFVQLIFAWLATL